MRFSPLGTFCALFSLHLSSYILPPISSHAEAPRNIITTMERLSDGDTLIATIGNDTKLRIRLPGIDAPEIPHGTKPGQPFGPLDTGDREA